MVFFRTGPAAGQDWSLGGADPFQPRLMGNYAEGWSRWMNAATSEAGQRTTLPLIFSGRGSWRRATIAQTVRRLTARSVATSLGDQ